MTFDDTCINCGKKYQNNNYSYSQFCSVGCQMDNFSDDSASFHSRIHETQPRRARGLVPYNPVTQGMVRLQSFDGSSVEVNQQDLLEILKAAEAFLGFEFLAAGSQLKLECYLEKQVKFIKGILE